MLLESITGGWLCYIMNVNGAHISILPAVKEHSYNIHQLDRDNKSAPLPAPFPSCQEESTRRSGHSLALSNCSETRPLARAACSRARRLSCAGLFCPEHSFHLAGYPALFLDFFFPRIHSQADFRSSCCCDLGGPLPSGQDAKSCALHRKAKYLPAGVYKCLEVLEPPYLKTELSLLAGAAKS